MSSAPTSAATTTKKIGSRAAWGIAARIVAMRNPAAAITTAVNAPKTAAAEMETETASIGHSASI